MYLDTQKTNQKLPKALEPIESLEFSNETTTNNKNDDGRLPTIETLTAEIEQQVASGKFESIAFSGEGEPTLRLRALCNIAEGISGKLPVRVTTNGLVTTENTADLLKSSGVSSLSVALMTHDPEQYDKIMYPIFSHSTRSHDVVCKFIQTAVSIGLEVEATAVERQDVDKARTQDLADRLGVTGPVRWRPYFP